MNGAVWGLTRDCAKEKLDEIKNSYIQLGIQIIREIKNLNEYSIIFDNGDCWRTIPSNTSSRGYKINISYIDHRIDSEIVNCIIKPCTVAMPYQAIHYF